MPSLDERIRQLEATLASKAPLGPTHDMPFAILPYDPRDELKLRREVELLATRIANGGQMVVRIDLADLMWECLEAHPMGPDALQRAESDLGASTEEVLAEARALLSVPRQDAPGPLERKVIEKLEPLDADRDIAFLVRAAELFPIYRTSALLERLMRHVRTRTVLFYPGTLTGVAELSFMGVCEPSPNYRPRVFA